MTGRISRIFINNLLAKTDIVDLIGAKVPLKKKGENYNTCCPFHNEKTPSFVVNNHKQFYYCFGCGIHGNAIDFIMNYEKLDFVETIEELASIHGLEVTYETNNNSNKIEFCQKKNLYKLMDNINRFYQDSLNKLDSYNAKQYLIYRGLTDEVIHHFSIGFAPIRSNDLFEYLTKYVYNHKELNSIGILFSDNNGRIHARFRKRIMFPIRDIKGRVIAFGGRTLDNTLPKYLNSPETDIFHKGKQLYGLYEAIKNNPEPSKLLVVEGYMDVIAMVQFGIKYTVASLGTSTTTDHIQLLFRITDTVIFCYDGDKAGRKAAWRTLKSTLPYLSDGRRILFMFLPNGEDP